MKDFGSAIILAGGKSLRMGFDKQKIILRNNRLIDRITDILSREFDELILVTNDLDLYKDSPYTIVEDEIKDMGPLGGIHTGLKRSSSRYSFVFACDMPVVNIGYIHMMKDKIAIIKPQACVARYKEWIEPFNAFYSISQIEEIEKHLGSGGRSVYDCLKKCNTFFIAEEEARRFSPDWDMFYNLNTREELACYVERVKGNY